MLLIVSCYTANLAASLTSKKLNTQINSAEDLIKSDIKFGTYESGSTMSMLKESKLKILNDLARGENIKFEDGHGLNRVLSEDFALISEDGTLNRYQGGKQCLLYKVGEPLIKVYQAIGLQKSIIDARKYAETNNLSLLDSPYTDRINKALLGFLNDGTLKLLEEKWVSDNDCSNDKVNSPKNAIQSFRPFVIRSRVTLLRWKILEDCLFYWALVYRLV